MFGSQQPSNETMVKNIKPWFNDSLSGRMPPFSVIPRPISGKKSLGFASSNRSDDGNESEQSNGVDFDDETDEDGEEEEYGKEDNEDGSSGISSTFVVNRKRADSKTTNLDSQVKKLLVGPASNDFGSKKFKQLSFNNRQLHSGLKNSHLINDIDAPPRVTLDDIVQQDREQEYERYSGSKKEQQQSKGVDSVVDNTLEKSNPESFNVFNSNFFSTAAKDPVSSSLASQPAHVSVISGFMHLNRAKESTVKEFSFIVYGYKEADSVQIVQYFSRYGELLENLEILNRKRNNLGKLLRNDKEPYKTLPIYLGSSWIKLTYSNQSSYLRALKEDGAVFKNYYLTVKPFTNELFESIRSGKLQISTSHVTSSDIDKPDTLFPNRHDGNAEKKPSMPQPSKSSQLQEKPAKNVLDSITAATSSLYSIFNHGNLPLLGNNDPITQHDTSLDPQPAKKPKTHDPLAAHRLPIKSGKQILLQKNQSNTNNKQLNSISSPHNLITANKNWLNKGLDWAFGLDSL